jgi:hypothetical protein
VIPNGRMTDVDGIRLEIHPEPSADEAAVIVSALKAKNRRSLNDTGSNVSTWRIAARHEALHRELSVGRDGWRIAARLEP